MRAFPKRPAERHRRRFLSLAAAGVVTFAASDALAADPIAAATGGCLSAPRRPDVPPAGPVPDPDEPAASSPAAAQNAGAQPVRTVIATAACLWDLPMIPRKITLFDRITLNFRAFIQYDAAIYDQNPLPGPLDVDYRRGTVTGPPSTEAIQAADMPNGGLFRRVRVGFDGAYQDDLTFKAIFEVGPNHPSGVTRVTEAWISYNRFAPFTVQIGAFPQPANMDDVTGAEDTLFLERATSAQLARTLGAGDGRLGVSLKYTDQAWTAAFSLTGPLITNIQTFVPKGALVSRVARTFDLSDEDKLHFGVDGTYVLKPANKDPSEPNIGSPIRFRDQPELKVDNTRLIDTADISASHAGEIGGEFAVQHRNFYLQAEDFWFEIERHPPTTLSNPQFSGYYVEGSWVITGERRPFDRVKGSFRNPQPKSPMGRPGGFGAVELAARFSTMNLNYRPGSAGQVAPLDGVRGGNQRILTIGLNWYPTAKMEVRLDYMHASVDRLNPASLEDPEPFGPPPLTPPIGVQIGQSLNMFAVRGQYIF